MGRFIGLLFVIGIVTCLFSGCSGDGGSDGNQGVLSFLFGSFSVNEDGTSVLPVTVQRVGGSAAVTVTIILTNGSATGGPPPLAPPLDYDNTPIVVSWIAGDLTDKVVNVPVFDDTTDEADETVDLVLSSPTGGAIIGVGIATLSIIDDDVAGALQFSGPAYIYNEDGTPVGMSVTVQRVGGIDGAVTATVVSADGTANSDPASLVEPVDFTPIAIPVAFADQDATDVVVNISLNLVQDQLPELNEEFTVSLSGLTGGALLGSPGSAAVTVIDDDVMLTITEGVPSLGSLFGSAVAKVGPSLAIGSPGTMSPEGRVYLVDPSIPNVVSTLDGGPFAKQYGASLAVHEVDTPLTAYRSLAIGSLGNVEVRNADTWGVRFHVPSALEGFGSAMIGLADGRLVIGAPFAQLGGIEPSGAAFVIDGLAGSLLQALDGAADDRFGSAFALFGGTDLLIGSPGNNGGVQRFGSNPLTLNLFIGDPVVEPSASFGQTVATMGNFVCVGKPDADQFALDGGIGYVIDGTTGSDLFTVFGAILGGRFGANAITAGGRFCVQHPGGGVGGSGSVVILSPNGIIATIADPAPTMGANFGASMCEFDGVLVIGAPMEDLGVFTDAGAVYIVKIP